VFEFESESELFVRIRIQPKHSDYFGFGFGSTTLECTNNVDDIQYLPVPVYNTGTRRHFSMTVFRVYYYKLSVCKGVFSILCSKYLYKYIP
jgi:hypothetical protein